MSVRVSQWRQPPDLSLVDRLEQLIAHVVNALDRREICDAEIAEINRLSGGRDYSSDTFFELYGAMSERDFAQIAAKGPPPIVEDLSREELTDIVGIVSSGVEPDVSYFLDFLNRNFPHSWSSDMIFWPHRELSNEEVVDELLLREGLFKTAGAAAVTARQIALAEEVLSDPNSPDWAKVGTKSVLRHS